MNMLEGFDTSVVECKITVLNADGTTEAHDYSSDPSENSLVKIMGGQITILGMAHSHDLILMKLRNSENQPANTHVPLPHPFTEETDIKGPVAVVKMNFQTSQPLDFSPADWLEFEQTPTDELKTLEAAAIEKRNAEAATEEEMVEGEPEEEEEEEYQEESDEEEDGDLSAQDVFTQNLVQKILDFYQEQFQREPTGEELKEAIKSVLGSIQDGTAVYDPENPEESVPATPEVKEGASEAPAAEPTGKRKLDDEENPEAKKAKTN